MVWAHPLHISGRIPQRCAQKEDSVDLQELKGVMPEEPEGPTDEWPNQNLVGKHLGHSHSFDWCGILANTTKHNTSKHGFAMASISAESAEWGADSHRAVVPGAGTG